MTILLSSEADDILERLEAERINHLYHWTSLENLSGISRIQQICSKKVLDDYGLWPPPQPVGIYTVLLIGGASMEEQLRAIKRGARILIATPGRLIDHMQRGTVRLNTTRILVLDEADRMFDMGFAPQIEQILQQVP